MFNPALEIIDSQLHNPHIADDISVDAKPGWAGAQGPSVKSEYTLPEPPGGQESHAPDTQTQALPPLMHMGYVGRHAQVSATC